MGTSLFVFSCRFIHSYAQLYIVEGWIGDRSEKRRDSEAKRDVLKCD